MGKKDVISYVPTLNEDRLSFMHNGGKNLLEPMSNNLSNHFIKSLAKRDEPKINMLHRMLDLRN